MHDHHHLTTAAQSIVAKRPEGGPESGETVLAAGIFRLRATTTATSGTVAAALASLAGAPTHTPLPARAVDAGTSAVAAVPATRGPAAAGRGLAVRMVVAVTRRQILLLDWSRGAGPSRILVRLDRSTTAVAVSRSGLVWRITLRDHCTGRVIPLVGTFSFVARVAGAGRRAVLAELVTARPAGCQGAWRRRGPRVHRSPAGRRVGVPARCTSH